MEKKEIRLTSPYKLIIVTTPQTTFSKNKLGRLYNPGRLLAIEERQKILHLRKKGYRISHIARVIGVAMFRKLCQDLIYRRTGSVQPCSIYSSERRNTDYNGGMNDNTVSNNNYQKLYRSCTVRARRCYFQSNISTYQSFQNCV